MKCDKCGVETTTLWLSSIWIKEHKGSIYGDEEFNEAKPLKKPYLCDFCFDSEKRRVPEGF